SQSYGSDSVHVNLYFLPFESRIEDGTRPETANYPFGERCSLRRATRIALDRATGRCRPVEGDASTTSSKVLRTGQHAPRARAFTRLLEPRMRNPAQGSCPGSDEPASQTRGRLRACRRALCRVSGVRRTATRSTPTCSRSFRGEAIRSQRGASDYRNRHNLLVRGVRGPEKPSRPGSRAVPWASSVWSGAPFCMGPQPPPGSSQGIRAHPASSPGREKSQTDDGGHSSPSSQFFETQPCGSIVAGRRCVLVGSQMKSSLAHTPDSAHGMGTHPLPSGGASSGAQRNPSRQSKATLGT